VVDEARERSADLIVIGLTYKKRFGEFDLGKTTPYVLKNAHCRVWVCRAEQVASVKDRSHIPVSAAASV
jgi:nucleotide-binding universal stress UspA family protein